MIIEIDDDLPPAKRRELLDTLPIKYGMEKFETMKEVAGFLGFSSRYVRNKVNEYEYLRILKQRDYYNPNLWGKYDRS